MLSGEGSNIVVAGGPQGALLVDAQSASATTSLLETLARDEASPVRILINTHWHEDHVGANAALGKQGALVLAHENSALRMQSEQIMSLYGPQAALAPMAWPRVAVQEPFQLPWYGESVQIVPFPPAHTDGDLVVWFRQQNVLVTGDLFVGYDYRPPYFDDLNGGSASGMLAAADDLLAIADADTLIVPGHGNPTNRAELERYRADFAAVRERIAASIARGLGEDAVVASHPAEGFARAGRGTDRWVRVLFREFKQSEVSTP